MLRKSLLALAAVFMLAGCAARGPTLAEKPDALPALADGKARLFVFRDVQRGGVNVDVLRPDILINGEALATSVAGGVHVRDLPSGTYTLSFAPPTLLSGYKVGPGVTVNLAAGASEYVKVRATHFSMNCYIGCSSSADFVIERVITAAERQSAIHRVLLSTGSK